MKPRAFLVLLATAVSLRASEPPATQADPLAGAFFPPEVVLLVADQIGLSADQRSALRVRVEQTQASASELTQRLLRETAALTALARRERIDETALFAQLDRLLEAERAMKRLQLGLLGAIKNALSPEQQAKIRDLTKDGAAAFIEAKRARLTEKVEQVKAGVQRWVASGRDPSAFLKTMQEKVKPLLDAGKVAEGEAELDQVLAQLK
ncbi:MAG: hypothetical protein JSR82_12770 [Verrucomicrobia bacterium]|nr:hypothetical protein [Verrucomicrobiota bacterium]